MKRSTFKTAAVAAGTVALVAALAACAPAAQEPAAAPSGGESDAPAAAAPAETPEPDSFGVVVAESWKDIYPNEYQTYMANESNSPQGKQDYLTEYPELVTMYAGYGFAKVDKQEKLRWGKMMQDYFEQSDELRHVLCLVDIRHEPTEDDKQMNLFLRQMGIPFTVIATKADKISRGARQKQLAPICRALLVQPWEVICWSSEDGTGRDQLLTLLEKVLAPKEEAPEA